MGLGFWVKGLSFKASGFLDVGLWGCGVRVYYLGDLLSLLTSRSTEPLAEGPVLLSSLPVHQARSTCYQVKYCLTLNISPLSPKFCIALLLGVTGVRR